MTPVKVEWTRLKNHSLFLSARSAGFDLSVYANYEKKPSVKKHMRDSTIKDIMKKLTDDYRRQTKKELKSIKHGVYVICTSSPFAIRYGQKHSNVIYIGSGNIYNRLKSVHFEKKLFDFMLELQGTNFDFYIGKITARGHGRYDALSRQAEHLLQNEFSKTFGESESKIKTLPLFNENMVSDRGIGNIIGWKKPLSNKGNVPKWILAPTKHATINKS